ncbi:hypothetical protein [Dryocola clanedunensis]
MTEKKYGFQIETYERGESIQVLQTGDGFTAFNTIYSKERDYVGIGFSYGNGDGNIGKRVVFDDGTTATDRECKWLIKFDNKASINALIAQLEELNAAIDDGYMIESTADADA